MAFTYTIEQTKDCINHTERQLRDLISTILSRKYGPDWEYSSPVWSDQTREELETRHREDQGHRPYQIVSQRLLDYSDIVDLRNIIEKYWDLFSGVFQSKERIMRRFDDLQLLRNPEMHGRPNILPHQKHLCLGICGEILLAVEHWRHGYEHAIKEYALELKFPVQVGTKYEITAQEGPAESLAQQWLEKTCSELGAKLRELSPENINTRTWQIAFQHMHVKVNTFCNQKGNDGRVFIRTSHVSALSQVIEAGKCPYWLLRWTLKDDLDVSIVASQVLELTGKRPSSSTKIQAGDINILTHAEFLIGGPNEENIRISLSRWRPDADAMICLICEGSVGTEFYCAHEVFSVKNVLSILYGELPYWKIRQMIGESCKLIGQA